VTRSCFFVLVLAACGPDAPHVEQHEALGGGVVARVGDLVISVPLVQKVAVAQAIEPKAAAASLIEDALAAEGAKGVGLDKSPEVRWPITSARARLTIDRIRRDALAQGLPTDEEVRELTARHWQAFDLPERVRVIHAVVLYPKTRDLDHDRPAKAVIDEIAKAVDGVGDASEFEGRAKAVPHEGVDVVVQALPPFVADGRAAEGNDVFDLAFCAAAFTLNKPGEHARVETRFGWHVIQLVERLPPHVIGLEERRIAFAEEVYTVRARKTYDAMLQRLRAANPVEPAPAAENLMKSLSAASAP
jgi:peptidyl-prolyl cis-trans isomerase C